MTRVKTAPALETVRLSDFSDRELLAIIADLTSGNGRTPTTARAVALRVFGLRDIERYEDEIAHATRCVGARFAWMKRYGLLASGDDLGEWVISPEGNALRTGTLAPAARRAVTGAGDTRLLSLANHVGERLVGAPEVAARAMQRELMFQITRRKRAAQRGARH